MKEIQDTTLAAILGSERDERAPEFGERAWRLRGNVADVIYWDLGNGWCDIIRVVPTETGEVADQWLQRFFDRVEASDDR
ncbi:MAG: hypothetical protein Q8O40_15360 [Chloroflexota bacterium]|nr:hypothetical protein [Chloroflexota bacterium]